MENLNTVRVKKVYKILNSCRFSFVYEGFFLYWPTNLVPRSYRETKNLYHC